jgi:transposase-like protein
VEPEAIVDEVGGLEPEAAGKAFRKWLRGTMRKVVAQVLAEEVSSLCGPSHERKAADELECYRAGNAPGQVLWAGHREEILRPRVRRRKNADASEEVPLQTYQAAQDRTALEQQILTALACGVSGREQKRLQPEAGRGMSKSAVSRLWIEASQKQLDEF